MRYNGWTNYYTWKVVLELGLLDGDVFEHDATVETIEEYVKDCLTTDNNITNDFIACIIEDIDFFQIQGHLKDSATDD